MIKECSVKKLSILIIYYFITCNNIIIGPNLLNRIPSLISSTYSFTVEFTDILKNDLLFHLKYLNLFKFYDSLCKNV
jgi:hypothetical protein